MKVRAAVVGLSLILQTYFVTEAAMANPTYQLLQFDELDGWAEDDHQAAFDVFLSTCGDMRDPAWEAICAVAHEGHEARGFFERFFTPVLIEDGKEALFTGYFEPELRGSLNRGGPYQYPLYRQPSGVSSPWLTRREIEETGALTGKGLEIAWIDDPVDVFFLQVQGSGSRGVGFRRWNSCWLRRRERSRVFVNRARVGASRHLRVPSGICRRDPKLGAQ